METTSAAPFASLREPGARDRLSLLAQFAAHQAFLQFAGLADGEVDPSDWAVVQKRGADIRLIRVAARACDASEAPPVLTLCQQFAELIRAPKLDVLRQSWARAEAVYAECHARLRADAAADLRWTQLAACGEIRSPGPDALRALWMDRNARATYADPSCLDALAFDPSLIVIRGGSILRYGALGELRARGITANSEAEIAEQVAALIEKQHVVFAVTEPLDEGSRRVVHLLMSLDGAAWVTPSPTPTLPDARHFILSPRLSARRALQVSSPEAFVTSDAYARYLDDGELPAPEGVITLPEPARSYLSALALLGTRIPRDVASRFLREFLYERPLEELVSDGHAFIENDHFVFASEATRAQIAKLIPSASRPALSRVAAEITDDPIRAATLLLDAGESARAAKVLESVPSVPIAVLRTLPRLSPKLAQQLADALIAEGRYRDARDVVPLLEEEARELTLARIERRLGDYAPALARLERIPRSNEADILRAEILMVLRRDDEARALIAETDDDYMRALLGIADVTPQDPYFAARLATYRAFEANDFDAALQHVDRSLAEAKTLTRRIDAQLDRMYALFAAGRWDDARHAAIEALADVEETQGDRAAGGFLFLLAYLCAEDGQWAHAAQRMTRLRHFYGATNDARHFAELDLIAAHLDFSRGRFAIAKRTATRLLDPSHDQPIREAAQRIVDEIAWIEGTVPPPPHNAFATATREALLAANPGTGSRKLQLFRAALKHNFVDLAQRIAGEMSLELEPIRAPESGIDMRVLRAAATADFPFAPHDLADIHWRFATRNRLGQWQQIGSADAVSHDALDRIADEGEADWIACSDKELLYLEGCAAWPGESRAAIAAVFRQRAELHRLRRLLEQEETASPPRAAVTGIIGESIAVRDVIALITRIAKRDVPVCILGESGTGKELVARAIHTGSARRHKPFTAVNCAALPENLIESELFGHVRGAFTGADRDRMGLIESTEGGTLFLDEIGEMPLAAQAKLLRFLQEGELRRVGDTVNRSADVRIVSATNRKLEAAVEEGRFREDLYYRISGVEVALPPLRERGGDILLLANHFLAAEREKHRGGPARFSEEVESIFCAYSWPGNVRELQNTIRGAHAMAGDARQIELEHLPERLRHVVAPRALAGSYQDAVARFRRDLIEKALLHARGNQNRAASMLKMSRQALAYQIRELGVLVGKRARP